MKYSASGSCVANMAPIHHTVLTYRSCALSEVNVCERVPDAEPESVGRLYSPDKPRHLSCSSGASSSRGTIGTLSSIVLQTHRKPTSRHTSATMVSFHTSKSHAAVYAKQSRSLPEGETWDGWCVSSVDDTAILCTDRDFQAGLPVLAYHLR